jgi:hypothetical protein
MVGLGRVELPTRSLGNCCSIHLSYSPAELWVDFISEGVNCGGESRALRDRGGAADAGLPRAKLVAVEATTQLGKYLTC